MDDFYSLGLLINRASTSLSKALNSALEEKNIDLPHSQFIVLRCLYYRDALSQLEIANLLSKDAAAIKRTIDNLENKGLVIRNQIRASKNCIYITKEGKKLIPEALKIADEIISKALENIDETDYNQLKFMLNKIYTNLGEK